MYDKNPPENGGFVSNLNMRMEYALMLLQNHQMTISLIAEMCGYENVYYFSNAFKNYFGYPPTKMN